MKKLLALALSCLLLCTLTAPALANGWGLLGGIYDIVSDDKRFADYTAIADDGNLAVDGVHVNHAILTSRYHTVLIAAHREGKVWTADTLSTTAVYQPGDRRGELLPQPMLTHDFSCFELSYGEEERYHFCRNEEEGHYHLTSARFGTDPFYYDAYFSAPDGLDFWQAPADDAPFTAVGDARWMTDGITLEEFNIAQMPRTLAEVRNVNVTRDALDTHAAPLSVLATRAGTKNSRKLPVYAAPSEESWRAASGKASVSLAEEVQVYGLCEGWTLISYEVSNRTSRFGYIEGDYADGQELPAAALELVTAADTFLTDDPFVSQYAQVYLPAGTQVDGIARCGEYYAYVQTSVDGQRIRGFIPMKDLTTLYDRALTIGQDQLMADVRWDVMDTLIGKWYTGENDRDKLVLFANGGFEDHYDPYADSASLAVGNYRVYGEDGQLTICFRTEDNQERTVPLILNEDGTITVEEVVLRRDEFSSYGNGCRGGEREVKRKSES